MFYKGQKGLFCGLVDYITDYGETAALCAETEKLSVHAALGDLLDELNHDGYGLLYVDR
jgi:hypothetical protein